MMRLSPGEPLVHEFASIKRSANGVDFIATSGTLTGAVASARRAMLAPANVAWSQRVLVAGACRGTWVIARV